MKTFLLTFANNEHNKLPTLLDEFQSLNNLLREQAHNYELRIIANPLATLEQVAADIQAYEESIYLFLFSGHAGRDYIELEDGQGKVEGISALLGRCANLKLVILNGCSTAGQVHKLLESGIPVVIATSAAVGDEKANRFSKAFFRSLSSQKSSILESFNRAIAAVKLSDSVSSNEIEIRGIGLESFNKALWGIYYYEHNQTIAKSPIFYEDKFVQKKAIEDLIAKNEIQKAIDILRSNTETTEEAAIVMAKFKKLERDVMLDLIPLFESLTVRAQVTSSILKIASQLSN